MQSPWPCYLKPPPRGEDLPYDDGMPMESEKHVLQMSLLIESLTYAWAGRDDFYVGGNMFVYYSELQAKQNDFRGPDVFVVLDTVRKVRKSWVVWEEDGRTPDLVIELTSPSTEAVDRGEKKRIYARALHVGEYFLFDPIDGRLEGYRLGSATGDYEPMTPDARGWYRCGRLGLWLGVVHSSYRLHKADWLRWIDDAGHVLQHGRELAEAAEERAEAALARAQAEAARAEEAKARLSEVERKLLASGMAPAEVAQILGKT